MSKPQRGDDGLYPTFAWPGGYPLYYIDRAGFTMCPDCVNGRDEEAGEPEDVDINWENDSLTCDDCGDPIESAYGEPEGERDGPFEEQYENEQFESGGIFAGDYDRDDGPFD